MSGVPAISADAPTIPPGRPGSLGERERIAHALEQCVGNQTRAAKMLGISRRTLIKKLDAYGFPRPRIRDGESDESDTD